MFYVSVAPFIILFGIFGAYPVLYSFYLGFTQWDGLDAPIFVGIRNYVNLFKDPTFLQSIYNTVYIWIGSTVLTLALAFTLAFMVQMYVSTARGFFRVVFLFPLLVAPALTAIILSVLFSTNAGLVNAGLTWLTHHRVAYDWFSSLYAIKPMIILLVVWRWTGWHFILFLSGLQTIPTDLYESARVDGASGKQIFFKITLPMLTPVMLVSAVTATIGGIQIFDEPYVLTGGSGGNMQTGDTMGLYLYQTAFQQFHFGDAAAMSYVIFAMIVVFSILNSRLLRKRT